MKPIHHVWQFAQNLALRDRWAFDHDDLQLKLPGRLDLGLRAAAASVLGHQNLGAMIAHQRQITGQIEGAARHLDPCGRKGKIAARRIDDPHQPIMLSKIDELRQMQAANGQKHPRGGAVQRSGCSSNVRNRQPVIARCGLPSRTLEGAKRKTHRLGSQDGIGADLRRERMGRINDLADGFGAQPIRKPGSTAEAPDPYRNGLRARALHPACIGQHSWQSLPGHLGGQQACLCRAPQNQRACHG